MSTYDPHAPRPYRRNTPEKFWSLVDKRGPDECWPWTRALNNGYGHFKYEDKYCGAHRLAYIFTKGEPPEGLVLDHLCRNRACCNPAHMEPVTNAENVLRGQGHSAQNARATKCVKGHDFTDGNTRIIRGARVCVTCSRARLRAQGERRRELIKADPSLAPHGSINTYSSWKCRCERCKSAWSEYMKDYHDKNRDRIRTRRAKRLQSGDLRHGRVSTYQAGCRCESCRAAKSAETRELRAA